MSSRTSVNPKNQAIRALPPPEPRPLRGRALQLAQSAFQGWQNTINGIAAGMDVDLSVYTIDVQAWRFVPIQRPAPPAEPPKAEETLADG